MSVTSDMVATYRGPKRVVARLLSMGPREDRALVILMAGCVFLFVARLPALAREAHLTGGDKEMAFGTTLFGVLFLLPLVLYLIALVSYWVVRVFSKTVTPYGCRIALFWALFATSPLALLNGLIEGFIGPGPGLNAVGLIWFVTFLWFWTSGLIQAGKDAA